MDDTNTAPRQLFSQPTEEAFLGAALIDPSGLGQIDLDPADMFVQRNRWIYNAMRTIISRGGEPDVITIADELERVGHLEETGGTAYLAGLVVTTPSSLGIESYASIIRDYARRRRIVQAANKLAQTAYAEGDIAETVAAVVDQLATGIRPDSGAAQWSPALDRLTANIVDRLANPSAVWGIPSGFADYDRATGGIQPGEMLYIAGEPGVGKSILAMQIGLNMAAAGHPGAIYSLEMRELQIVRRAISATARVETKKIKSGNLTDEEITLLTDTIKRAADWPLYLSDEPDLSTAALRADLARLKLQHGIQWFVLDYLYLMSDGDGKLDDTQRTALLSRRIKTIASSLGIAAITVNSVTKDGMGKGSEPTQKNIRGSGQVIHDADTIIFLTPYIEDGHVGIADMKASAARNENLRTVTFGKGRELESTAPFHLVKLPSYPAFGDYAGRDAMSGRVTTPTQSRGAINPAAQR